MIDLDLLGKEYSFTTTDESGKEVICDTLAVIEKDGYPVIVYTDYTLDKDNNFNMFISKVVGEEGSYTLEPIDNYDDIPEIRKVLDELMQQQ